MCRKVNTFVDYTPKVINQNKKNGWNFRQMYYISSVICIFILEVSYAEKIYRFGDACQHDVWNSGFGRR